MNEDFDFYKTAMPETRKADYCLGFGNGSVFLDFNRTYDDQIYLVRISFDDYGCCNLDEQTKHLNKEDSRIFIEEFEKVKLDQEKISILVKEVIKSNQEQIWTEPIEEYGLLERE